jgi:hypothetical protein
MKFKLRNFIVPFSYIYRRLYELIHNSNKSWNYENANMQSSKEPLHDRTLYTEKKPAIQPPFPLRIKIPPD